MKKMCKYVIKKDTHEDWRETIHQNRNLFEYVRGIYPSLVIRGSVDGLEYRIGGNIQMVEDSWLLPEDLFKL